MNRCALYALLAAALFGASAPMAKVLLGELPPVQLAGLLYLGSGVGLSDSRVIRARGWRPGGLAAADWPWLVGAMLFGGVLAPVALLFGLANMGAAGASLLLNLEAVFTALIAWTVFREHTGRRLVLGMAAIAAGSLVLGAPAADGPVGAGWLGPLAVAGACLCWAIDNNLTRRVSAADALFIAACKGGSAGVINLLLAALLGDPLPSVGAALASLGVGLFGYGISLVLFVLALRGLGTARTGAYFATAPFIGAAAALALPGESTGPAFWFAGILMGWGVWLHLSEDHAHQHTHEPIEHSHRHVHDMHHGHAHEFDWDGREPHTHLHHHGRVTHKHPHFPDIHHRHHH
jgi:drug/metabolite transporter (DMT)-like permease